MTRFIKWLFIACFVVGILLGMLAANSLDDYSNVPQVSPLSSDQLKRVKKFIKLNKPANLQSGQVAISAISQRDLNNTLNYLAQKAPHMLRSRIRAKIMLEKQQALIQLSMQLPSNPVGQYINVTTSLRSINSENKPQIEIQSMKIGSNTLPNFLAQLIANYIHQQLILNAAEYGSIVASIQNINFKNKKLSIEYVWDRQVAEKLKGQLSSRVISKEFKQALIAHANHLSRLSHKLPSKPGFNDLLKPMISYAMLRSKQHNPVIENKAAFIALGAYSLNKNIPKILGEKPETIARGREIYLKGRHDLSKHFMLSAAITSMADSAMASSVGLEKEVKDSQGGTGFSFADLAADHAGIALAEESTSSESQARRMQIRLSKVTAESDYMPQIDNLPEGLAKADFEYQYTDTKSSAYKKIERLISSRIKNLAVYKEMN